MRHQKQQRSKSSLGTLVWIGGVACASIGLATQNGILTAYAIIAVPVLFALLWNRAESPVLLFACGVQWLQATMPIFYADFNSNSIDNQFRIPHMERAILLSITGVIFLAIGVSVGWTHYVRLPTAGLESEAKLINQPRLFFIWLVSFILGFIAESVAYRIPSLMQIIIHVSTIKWVFFFMLAYQAFILRRGMTTLMIATAIEFVMGFTGHFSTYKEAIFMLMIVAFIADLRLNFKAILVMAAALALVLYASIMWSAVKMPYRAYLASGGGSESIATRLGKIASLVGDVDEKRFADGIERLVARISYTEYFARVLAHVPSQVPFAEGELWVGAIRHITQPRLLFPNKPALDDSSRLRRYTGVKVSGMESATSIGMGYMAESYIDFGPVWMFFPILLLGMAYGLTYRWLVYINQSKLMGIAIANAAVFFALHGFATQNVKLVGALVTVCIVLTFISRCGAVTLMKMISHDLPNKKLNFKRGG